MQRRNKQSRNVMAKKKQQTKAKEPVAIRFKQLAGGGQSIYLDIYVKGKRRYEFLKLYLVPETDAASRAQNANALQAANAIKAQRIMDIANERAGLKVASHYGKVLLVDWLDIHDQQQKDKGRGVTMTMAKQKRICEQYKPGAKLEDIDKAWVLGYIKFIRTYVSHRTKRVIAQNTQCNYITNLSCALNAAVRAEYMAVNPFTALSPAERISTPESQRAYLTIDEIKRLIETPCKREDVKAAFLFSCFCGLRLSDVCARKWGNLTIESSGKRHLEIRMKKTKAPIYLPISDEAFRWLPERSDAKDGDVIFPKVNQWAAWAHLGDWTKAAGITKHITFHCSRHTFATMMLTLGADIYTTKDLLGHADVRTTQIYAEIVNEKKDAAVNLTNGLFNK